MMSRMDDDAMQQREVFGSALRAGLAALGLDVPTEAQQRMFEHFQLVVEANQRFNLTRITSPAEAAVKHYVDSLSLLASPWAAEWVKDRLQVLDVGTGAGFPAVPLAVVRPGWTITAIDGTNKKVSFLAEAAEALGLTNLDPMHARAADLVRENQDKGRGKGGGGGDWKFDLIVARAVGQMEPLLAEVAPLLGPRGSAVFYKTAHVESTELDAATAMAHKLKLKMQSFRLDLPLPCEKNAAGATEILARQLIQFSR